MPSTKPMPSTSNNRPTVIDGLRRREEHARRTAALSCCDATGRTERGSSVVARCVACGAVAHDWRRLVGVGARVSAAGTRAVKLTYEGACGRCGGADLVLGAPQDVEDGALSEWRLSGALRRFIEETGDGEKRLVTAA